MAKTVSIVDARRELGRLAEEVHRTGQAVVLTRRGRAIARLVPDASSPREQQRPAGELAALRCTVELRCTPQGLLRAITELRREFTRSAQRRTLTLPRAEPRRRG